MHVAVLSHMQAFCLLALAIVAASSYSTASDVTVANATSSLESADSSAPNTTVCSYSCLNVCQQECREASLPKCSYVPKQIEVSIAELTS